jgi:signal transduction histidine kinase
MVLYSQHQKRIINNILTLSKLDLNLILISLTQFNQLHLSRILYRYKAYLRDARVKASFSINQSYHNLTINYVVLNPAHLLQVLINLLTNTIKFRRDSRKRHITILLSASLKQPSSRPSKVSYIRHQESRAKQPSSRE